MNEEEVEGRLDAYSELKTTLEEVKPGDKKIPAIVSMMGYTSLDNLEALRDNLKLAGWRINDIQLAVKGWGYRRGLIKSEEDIEDLVKVEKAEKEEKEEEKGEEEIKEDEKELEGLVKQKFRDTGRLERIKLYRDILASKERKTEVEEEEEEKKITYVVGGIPIPLTTSEYLAMKRWEEEKERKESKEKEEKEEREELKKESEGQKETITWKFRDGEIKDVSPDALGYVIISDVLLEELKGLKEKKEETKGAETVRVTLPDGKTLEVREDFYPYVMQIEREKEHSAELRSELSSLKEQFNSFNPWSYVKEQTEVMKEMGWTQTPTGRTAWDVAAQATSDIHSSVTFLGGKLLDNYGIAPEFTPEERYTEEEKRSKKEELGRKTAYSKDLMKAESEILSL